MKSISTALILLLLVSGCSLNDSYKNCFPDTDLYLEFEYLADTKNNVLRKHISHSRVYIYDNTDLLIDSFDVNQNGLIHGKDLGVFPIGEYTFISWANMHNQTEITQSEFLETGRLNTLKFKDPDYITGNDPLYYAQQKVTITKNYESTRILQKDTLKYQSAHINFRVIVHGMKDKEIKVVFNHLMPEYDFNMNSARPYETSYHPIVVEEDLEEDGYKRLMEFAALRFKDKNQITIELLDLKSGELITPKLSLEQLMLKNEVSVENKQEVTLLIEFRISDNSIQVTLKEWEEQEIIPGN